MRGNPGADIHEDTQAGQQAGKRRQVTNDEGGTAHQKTSRHNPNCGSTLCRIEKVERSADDGKTANRRAQEKQADTRQTAWKCRKKSLQKHPRCVPYAAREIS